MYKDYYLRASEQDWPQLLEILVSLEVLKKILVEDQSEPSTEETTQASPKEIIVAAEGYNWDYIGKIYKPTGAMVDGVPEVLPLKDPSGLDYLHANIRTVKDLRELIDNHPEVLPTEDLPKYFVLDENGQFRVPVQPYRAWF